MPSDKQRSRVILSQRQYEVLKTIEELGGREIYYTQIVRKMGNNITWAHAVNILRQFDKMGIINTKKAGRVRLVELTDKGKKLLEHAKAIVELMKPIEQ